MKFIYLFSFLFFTYFVLDTEKGVTANQIKEAAINASDKVYEQDDLGPVQSIKNSLGSILTQISQLSQFLQDNEYEINMANKNKEKVRICFYSDDY